jgi:hypothetical protein
MFQYVDDMLQDLRKRGEELIRRLGKESQNLLDVLLVLTTRFRLNKEAKSA